MVIFFCSVTGPTVATVDRKTGSTMPWSKLADYCKQVVILGIMC